MDKKDIIIVDYINQISTRRIDTDILEKLNIRVRNIRKYRGRIERRKEKINRLYGQQTNY